MRNILRQIFLLTAIQFKEFVREPAILFWTLGFPVLMAWGLGIAFTKQSEAIHHAGYISDKPLNASPFSNFPNAIINGNTLRFTIGDSLKGADIFTIHKVTEKESLRKLKRGEISLIIKDYNNTLYYHFDPKNPEAKLTHLLLSTVSDLIINKRNIVPLKQTGLRYIDFLLPGLITLNIMSSAMWGIGYYLVERRSKKLNRRMAATPMNRFGYLSSFIISRILLSSVETFVIWAFSYFVFDVSFTGSFFALVLLLIAGNICFSGIALVTTARVANVQIGNGVINAVTLPMMVCSGIFFSYHNFPDWAISIIKLFPLTMLTDGTRSLFIESAGISDVFFSIFYLFIGGVLCLLAGVKLFRWY